MGAPEYWVLEHSLRGGQADGMLQWRLLCGFGLRGVGRFGELLPLLYFGSCTEEVKLAGGE